MWLRYCWLMLLILYPACRLHTPAKSSRAKAIAQLQKPLPKLVLIDPELVGRECVVEERGEDQQVLHTYTGKLVRFTNDVVEIEKPAVTSTITHEKQVLFWRTRSSALASDQMIENKTLARSAIASVHPVDSAPVAEQASE